MRCNHSSLYLFVCVTFGCLLLISCSHHNYYLCDDIVLKEGTLRLTQNEKIIVCGSSKGQGNWRSIPLPQAQYQLTVLFQKNGYLNPRFERDQDQLSVWSGPQTETALLIVEGADGLVDSTKKRKIEDFALTPDKLNEVQSWIDTELRSQGYACPVIQVEAQEWDKKIVAKVQLGFKQKIKEIDSSGLADVDLAAIERYQTFKVGEYYDVRKTQLTISRMLADGVIQNGYFTVACHEDGVSLKLFGDAGPPKLLSFEVGASTEELPFLNLNFKNTRIDRMASSYNLGLHASPRLQNITGSSELYILPWTKKFYAGPRFKTGRTSEKNYEFLEAKAGADIGRVWDFWQIRWKGRLGPTLNYIKTAQGIGPDDVSYFSWEGSLSANNHDYETSLRTQYEGWDASFDYRAQRKGLGSEVNVNRYDLNYKKLWNIGNFAPPLFVLGIRLELNLVDTEDIATGNSKAVVPIDYRIFWGGADNLRGFSRKSLNNGDLGYLTAAYAGFELRLIEQIPWKLEPFLLYDLAKLGVNRYAVEDSLFTSAGLGLRWISPFGTLRGSAAKGRIYKGTVATDAYPQEWVYFFSFGQEF